MEAPFLQQTIFVDIHSYCISFIIVIPAYVHIIIYTPLADITT